MVYENAQHGWSFIYASAEWFGLWLVYIFLYILKQIFKDENSNSLNQQILSDRCGTVLKSESEDYIHKRRLTIASGQL